MSNTKSLSRKERRERKGEKTEFIILCGICELRERKK